MIVASLAFFLLSWPYDLGTFIAVQAGAPNPSGVRTTVGWLLELPWLALLVVVTIYLHGKHSQRLQQMAAFHAPRATRGPGHSIVYHHGACTANHRTPDAAGRCQN